MHPFFVLTVVAGYFILLLAVSWFTSRNADSQTFFTANRKSPWYIVAFGMVGASLSGVTFISVPGEVGNSAFSYLQFVLGNLVGFWLVAGFLLPLYYKMRLVTIYTFLGERFGRWSHKTGSFFFIVSKLIGAAFRLYLVASVLQIAFFNAFQVPFAATVAVSIALIWVYTFRGGIKTIVWTDTLQTFFLVSSVVLTLVVVSGSLGWNLSEMVGQVRADPMSRVFIWEWRSGDNFFKQFVAGIFITLVMVGMDQDMMQKNLTCRSLREARKNMVVFSLAFTVTVVLFLSVGALLYLFARNKGLETPEMSDDLFPWLAFNHLGMIVGVSFLLGVIAAAYSSADSALTALTTSLSVDFLKIDRFSENLQRKIRMASHLFFSAMLILIILAFKAINNQSVVVAVFQVAGYTYGPILGLFLFGMVSKRRVRDKWVPVVALLTPTLAWMIASNSEEWLFGYKFGFEILLLNGLFMVTGLLIISRKTNEKIIE